VIYGYIRVSTDKQDCENQKLGIESKASALGLCIDKYIEDAGIVQSVEQRTVNGQRGTFPHHYKPEIFRGFPLLFWQCVIYDSLL
jgi:hypothetical protein